jgi:EpsI family protein
MSVTSTLTGARTRGIIVAVCFIAAWGYLSRASRAETVLPRTPLDQLAFRVGDWTGRNDTPMTDEIIKVLGVDDHIVRIYAKASTLPVAVYVGFYQSQRQGDTIHSPLNCLPGAGWEPLEVGRTTLSVHASPFDSAVRPIEINRVVIGKGLDRQLVLYWYQSGNRVVASEYWGKIYTVLDAVRYNRTDAALVRIVVPIRDKSSPESADAAGRDFVDALFPLLGRHLPV